MSNLPVSWISVQLGDVVDYGNTSKAEPTEIAEDSWILELEDIEKTSSKLIQRVLFSERQSKSTKNKFEKNDVLYGKLRPYLDKVIIAQESGYCTTEIIPIKPGKYLDKRFLFYGLKRKEFIDYVSEVSHGLNMPRLGTKQGQAAPFVLAPLNEQTRIADKLDSVLAKVDAAQARLEKIPTLLKRFRQSVLAAATSGELTREWRESCPEQLENPFIPDAIDVYDGQSLEPLPSNWNYLPFHKAADIKSNLVDPKLTPEAIHLAPNHVESNTGKILELVTVQKDEVKSGKHTFFSGQIVYSKIRPYLNKVCVVGFDGLCSADMYPIDAKIETKYLFYYMLSERFVNWTSQQQGRVVLPKINQNALNKIPVPTPSITEQKEIVRRVESLFALADTVEKQYLATKQRTDRLTQSLLAKAFRGELVPQDPNDEPAAELLKRIQAERNAQPSVKHKRTQSV